MYVVGFERSSRKRMITNRIKPKQGWKVTQNDHEIMNTSPHQNPKLYTTPDVEYQRQIIVMYCSKLCPRTLINGHWVFVLNSLAHSLRTAKPKEAGSRSAGASPSSVSIDEYASSIIHRVQRKIRVSFSVSD